MAGMTPDSQSSRLIGCMLAQMLRAVTALKRLKKQRERHLAAIPESDDEEEFADLTASCEVSQLHFTTGLVTNEGPCSNAFVLLRA